MPARLTLDAFLEKAKAAHPAKKYDYSQIEYINSGTHLSIICPTHGVFKQTPHTHLKGRGCRKCGYKHAANNRKNKLTDFVKKAKTIHAGKNYDYSKAVYSDSREKLIIICPIHGDFEQTPRFHVVSNGCPKCWHTSKSDRFKSNLETFISKAQKTHIEGNYDYSKAVYVNSQTKLIIGCKTHGDFHQIPAAHISGQGCPKCGEDRTKNKLKLNFDDFIKKAKQAHPDKNFIYRDTRYANNNSHIQITCQKHGNFEQRPYDHLDGHGCPKCAGRISKQEIEIAEFIQNLGFNILTNKAINREKGMLRFDIIIESKKLVVEFNGVFWHSTLKKDRDYHIKKRKLAESLGYEMLSIWQDDYETKKDKVEALLRRKLLGVANRVYARKTDVTKLPTKQTLAFHRKHHLQESKPGSASLHYALTYEDEIIAAASFDKNGVLHRYTIKGDTSVIGGMSKLIAAYRAEMGNIAITTYCDKDYFGGGLYVATGFKKMSETLQLTYLHHSRRIRRENFMKHKLPSLFGDVDMSKTEMQICQENNIFACFNSGVEKLVLPPA